jgi:hypothetical protein
LIEGVAAPKDALSANILHLISLEGLEAELRINQADLQTSDEGLLVGEDGIALAKPHLYLRKKGVSLTPSDLDKVMRDFKRGKETILSLAHKLASEFTARI